MPYQIQRLYRICKIRIRNKRPGQLIKKNKLLAGSIRLQNIAGNEYSVKKHGDIYKLNENFKSGTLFRIYLQNSEPAYVYTFGFDKTEKVFSIFPHKNDISAFLSYSNNEVVIPDETHFIETDETTGKNYICVLLSKKTIDTEKLYKNIESQYGTFYKRIDMSIQTEKISKNNTIYLPNKTSFSASSNSKTCSFIILEANHVK